MKNKKSLILFLPVAFLVLLSNLYSQKERITVASIKVVKNKQYKKISTRRGWHDTEIEMDVIYHPSILRRLQLMHTKWPEDFAIEKETYLIDENGNRFYLFNFPTGRFKILTYSDCEWNDCLNDGNKLLANYSREFRSRWTFPVVLNQVPQNSKKVFLHTQFQAGQALSEEITFQVR